MLGSPIAPRHLVLAGCFALIFANMHAAPLTALDRYVQTPDPAYHWEVVRTVAGPDLTTFVLEMTSQTWLTTNEVDRPLWKHWLTILRPNQVRHHTGLLFIGGGRNDRPAPSDPDPNLAHIAHTTRSVVAELRMVPNQPLVFGGDGHPRFEDDLIAYTWDRFLRTGQEHWLARFPMTKSAVRALDTVTAFCASPAGGELKVDRFFVSGGSKRGWTTWTTAAVDPRVVAIAPVVIDLLNLEPSFIHHFEAYGFYAPAVQDYQNFRIMEWQGTPEYRRLLELVEPYQYRARFTMPKFIINATGDQFFLPDSSQFYFQELPGTKYLRYVPNGDHSLKDTDAFETLAASYHAILNQTALPQFAWAFLPDGSISVNPVTTPAAVKLWQATNPEARDFRLDVVGKIWEAIDLAPDDQGAYHARVSQPTRGWTAFMVELTFDYPDGPAPFKFTTAVRVMPEAKPFSYRPPTQRPAPPTVP